MNTLLRHCVARLHDAAYAADKPDETPESTAMALWFAACGEPRAASRAHPELPPLSDGGARALEALVDRRLAGEPLAYLVGRQEFMGLELLAGPGALIPRRETELLADAAIAATRQCADRGAAPRVLDLCTGSGNLAVAIAVHEPRCRVWASDLHADALEVAARNAALHGVTDRITLLEGNLFEPVRGLGEAGAGFDVVVCNPPYIPSHKAANMPREVGGFEPRAAFDGGDFGVSILVRIVSEAAGFMVPGGQLCFEVGAGQARGIAKRLSSAGRYTDVRELADRNGVSRVLLAQHAPTP